MEQIMNYIKPELLVLVPVLYILGMGLKKAQAVKDEHIPVILGGVGVILSALWLLGTAPSPETANPAMLIFTAIVQGLLVAGMAVYANQLAKQGRKAQTRPVQLERQKLEALNYEQLLKLADALSVPVPLSKSREEILQSILEHAGLN